MSVSTSVILDTRRLKKNGRYPLKLRDIHQRVTTDYKTIYDLSEEEYKKLNAPRITQELQNVRTNLQDLAAAADRFIKQATPFNILEFEQEFISCNPILVRRKTNLVVLQSANSDGFDYRPFLKRFTIFSEDHSVPGSISITFLSYIKKLLQQGRIGSAINYQRTYRSLKAFRGNVTFTHITVGFLYQYETWMLKKNVSKTTVGIVLRPLRSIFNEAIEDGVIRREKCYPFGRRKYQIPASRNIKKALTEDDLAKIFYYHPSCSRDAVGRAYWLFCYLANGMNVKDMIQLKWKNIDGDYLIFERSKTEKSVRNDQRPIVIYLSDDLWDIINEHGNKNRLPNEYLFPISQPDLNPLEQFDLLNYVRRLINQVMSQIALEVGITKKVTSIVTRHSFSTQLKRSGVSTEYIQEALGHTNIKTTENYLDSFEREIKKEFAQKLTAFRNK